ncbi:hypothetical protein HGRIS_010285 [Hohenbuehelia grisea]|uniref:Uncharacterized protein n=1 Tax=Hohenbuehelia grisea TaxID=104357 RepID=A0ABR3J4D0_9AGAR
MNEDTPADFLSQGSDAEMHTVSRSRNSQSRNKRQNSQDAHSLSSEAPTKDEAVDYDVQEDEDLQEISDTNELRNIFELELPQFNSPAARRSASPQEISATTSTRKGTHNQMASIRTRSPAHRRRPPIQLGHARQPLIMASETMMSSSHQSFSGLGFAPAQQSSKPKAKPQWSAGPSTSDTHASPKPRHRKHSIDQALESAGLDLNDVDVNTERDAPTVSNSGWPTEAHFTPKAPGQRSLNLKAQPLALQSVLRTAIRNISKIAASWRPWCQSYQDVPGQTRFHDHHWGPERLSNFQGTHWRDGALERLGSSDSQ